MSTETIYNKRLLIVDDNDINRTLLKRIFIDFSALICAENGRQALKIMEKEKDIALVLLDLSMPVLDGFAVMDAMKKRPAIRDIPVVVVTASNDDASQIQALDRGAVDLITKPFSPQIVLHRVRNILLRRDAEKLAEENRLYESKLRQQSEYLRLTEIDEKTGIYNKNAFCYHTSALLKSHPGHKYVILRWDLDNFKIYNDFFGIAAGDQFLAEIGSRYRDLDGKLEGMLSYGHWEADHFVSCHEAESFQPQQMVEDIQDYLHKRVDDFDFVVHAGYYEVEDPDMDVALMCDRALLALKSVKHQYNTRSAPYTKELLNSLIEEQAISNEMEAALAGHQFQIYLQPQFNYALNHLSGGEVLVRWVHPQLGVILPDRFIPIFERNGFITRLDAEVREQACALMRDWLDRGLPVCPISVNISRRNIYNPNLCKEIAAQLNHWRIPHELIHLEITESALMENPRLLVSVVEKLHALGFVVEMDDFGSGYSSLNSLSEIPVDVIKLDVKFIAAIRNNQKRIGSILNYVVRMAHAIRLSVIAEGVETREEAEYLLSIGCSLMQGFYFARPLPAADFGVLLMQPQEQKELPKLRHALGEQLLVEGDTRSALIFNRFVGAAAIVERTGDSYEVLRCNDAYLREIGVSRADYMSLETTHLEERLDDENREIFREMLRQADAQEEAECEITTLSIKPGYGLARLHLNVQRLNGRGNSATYYLSARRVDSAVPAIDPNDVSRLLRERDLLVRLTPVLIRIIYEDGRDTTCFGSFIGLDPQAAQGNFASRVLAEDSDAYQRGLPSAQRDKRPFYAAEYRYKRDNGRVILLRERGRRFADVANGSGYVSVCYDLSDGSEADAAGFIATDTELARRDGMTGLLNRLAMEKCVNAALADTPGRRCALLMVDLDDLKSINDTLGHCAGDEAIRAVADALTGFFRQGDAIARIGGDEFMVLLPGLPCATMLTDKMDALRKCLADVPFGKEGLYSAHCSVGIAFGDCGDTDFTSLYHMADTALYAVKRSGKCNLFYYSPHMRMNTTLQKDQNDRA